MSRSSPKIFIGLLETAGYFNSLNEGFKSIGIKSRFINLCYDDFSYNSQSDNLIVQIFKFAFRRSKRGFIQKYFWTAIMVPCMTLLFVWAVLNFDIFIFSKATSFYKNYELPLLKILRKKIVFVFLGTEARPPYISGKVILEGIARKGDRGSLKYLYDYSRRKKKQIKKIEKYADIIISHPPIAHFQETRFFSHLAIGLPFRMRHKIVLEQRMNERIRILHAPSTPESKGTVLIREIVQKLKNKGCRIDYIEVFNVPNSEVLKELDKCDFVVDELYSDTPLGALGTEAAFYGKPTINGGYYAQRIKCDYPDRYIPPAVYCLPDQIEQAIEKLISDKEFRINLGLETKKYVENNWAAHKVAQKYMQIINNNFPKDWLFDPKNITYLHGYGLLEKTIKETIRSYIEKYGIKALQLFDKPELERRFIEFTELC